MVQSHNIKASVIGTRIVLAVCFYGSPVLYGVAIPRASSPVGVSTGPTATAGVGSTWGIIMKGFRWAHECSNILLIYITFLYLSFTTSSTLFINISLPFIQLVAQVSAVKWLYPNNSKILPLPTCCAGDSGWSSSAPCIRDFLCFK